jgi:hypothetical protein
VGGAASSGIKYHSAKYRKMPGNAALKKLPTTHTTRNREEGQAKCFASPPQTPAIRLSSRERLTFIFLKPFSILVAAKGTRLIHPETLNPQLPTNSPKQSLLTSAATDR